MLRKNTQTRIQAFFRPPHWPLHVMLMVWSAACLHLSLDAGSNRSDLEGVFRHQPRNFGAHTLIQRAQSAEDSAFLVAVFLFVGLVVGSAMFRAANAEGGNPNLKIIKDFFDKHPQHPGYKKENSVKIRCPLLWGESEQPVCISYMYKKMLWQHAYDYNELKKYFLSESGTRCPFTSAELMSDKVSSLEISFEIPENVPEFIQPEVEQKTTDVLRRVGCGA